MQRIDISINKAELKNIEVELLDKEPHITATLYLFAGEKKVSEFRISTRSWFDDNTRFKLPIGMIDPIKRIAYEIETIATRLFSSSIGALAETNSNTTEEELPF